MPAKSGIERPVESVNTSTLLALVENTAPITQQIELTIMAAWAMFLDGLDRLERERASKASGTEPKAKVYIEVVHEDRHLVRQHATSLRTAVHELLESIS